MFCFWCYIWSEKHNGKIYTTMLLDPTKYMPNNQSYLVRLAIRLRENAPSPNCLALADHVAWWHVKDGSCDHTTRPQNVDGLA